jgi:hypothetical protein
MKIVEGLKQFGILLGVGTLIAFLVALGEFENRLENTQVSNKELQGEMEKRIIEFERIASVQTVTIDNLSNKKVDVVERIDTKDGQASFDLGKVLGTGASNE